MQHWKIPWNVLFWTCLPQNLTNSLMKLCTLHFSFLFIYLFITKNIKDVFEVLNKVLYKWNVHCCRIVTDYECLICVNSNSVSSQELKCVLSKADCVMREESYILGNIPVWMFRKIMNIQLSALDYCSWFEVWELSDWISHFPSLVSRWDLHVLWLLCDTRQLWVATVLLWERGEWRRQAKMATSRQVVQLWMSSVAPTLTEEAPGL